MSISAHQVKELREKTGAGMMDCKKALIEANGNFEEAIDWLRKKGLASASKKSSRVASDGLIAVEVKGNRGAIIELNSETDFVSKNDKFQELAKNLVSEFVSFDGNLEAFQNSTLKNSGKKVSEEVSEHIAVIGENIRLRRGKNLHVENGVITSYLHNSVKPGLGKIGVLIALETSIEKDKVDILGKQIAMHIAAIKPDALSIDQVDTALVEREKDVYREQAKASGKPENVIEKMIEGRVSKYYEQIVLLEQVFVMDGKTKIKDVLANFAKEHGQDIKIKEFVCFTLGEGIEKEETNFAQEVASMAKR